MMEEEEWTMSYNFKWEQKKKHYSKFTSTVLNALLSLVFKENNITKKMDK